MVWTIPPTPPIHTHKRKNTQIKPPYGKYLFQEKMEKVSPLTPLCQTKGEDWEISMPQRRAHR